MTDHLRAFAKDLVDRHGPRTTGEIWHAFSNVLGNYLPGGDNSEEQKTYVRDHLKEKSEHLAHDADSDSFGPKPVESPGGDAQV